MNFYTIASIIREISLYILTLRYLSISFYTLFPLHFSFIFGYKFIFILIFIHYIGVWWEFMNFYSPIFLNGITYITFTHFFPPPIFIQNVYFNTKTYTIYLWILALFFYDTHHELEIIYFFFPNTKSPKRKYAYDNSELLCPAPITYTIIKTTKEFADDTATSSLMISSR